LLKRLIAVDPENAQIYQSNYDNFIAKWNLAIIKWEKRAKVLKDMPIIVKHNHWAYLVDWLGLKVVATLEEKPGIEPSSGYLATVLSQVQKNPAKMIIYAPYENKTPIFWLSNKSQTKAVLLPFTIYGTAGARDLFGLFNDTLNILIKQSQRDFVPNQSLIKSE
jgi:zinc/manganese transport system substrate-binding protein